MESQRCSSNEHVCDLQRRRTEWRYCNDLRQLYDQLWSERDVLGRQQPIHECQRSVVYARYGCGRLGDSTGSDLHLCGTSATVRGNDHAGSRRENTIRFLMVVGLDHGQLHLGLHHPGIVCSCVVGKRDFRLPRRYRGRLVLCFNEKWRRLYLSQFLSCGSVQPRRWQRVLQQPRSGHNFLSRYTGCPR